MPSAAVLAVSGLFGGLARFVKPVVGVVVAPVIGFPYLLGGPGAKGEDLVGGFFLAFPVWRRGRFRDRSRQRLHGRHRHRP